MTTEDVEKGKSMARSIKEKIYRTADEVTDPLTERITKKTQAVKEKATMITDTATTEKRSIVDKIKGKSETSTIIVHRIGRGLILSEPRNRRIVPPSRSKRRSLGRQ